MPCHAIPCRPYIKVLFVWPWVFEEIIYLAASSTLVDKHRSLFLSPVLFFKSFPLSLITKHLYFSSMFGVGYQMKLCTQAHGHHWHQPVLVKGQGFYSDRTLSEKIHHRNHSLVVKSKWVKIKIYFYDNFSNVNIDKVPSTGLSHCTLGAHPLLLHFTSRVFTRIHWLVDLSVGLEKNYWTDFHVAGGWVSALVQIWIKGQIQEFFVTFLNRVFFFFFINFWGNDEWILMIKIRHI